MEHSTSAFAGSNDLAGAHVLVTGASRGIGRATAELFGRLGCTVCVHYGRDEAAAAQTVSTIRGSGGTAFAVRANLADADGPEELIDRYRQASTDAGRPEPGIDVLVNNAATNTPAPLSALTAQNIGAVFDLNVRAVLLLTRHAVDLMPDGGRIVNVSSGVTRVASPGSVAYAASKGALDVLTVTLAAELGPRRIRVNGVAPGVVDTDINASWLRSGDESVVSDVRRLAALGRVGEPEDIAAAIAWLAGDGSRWITGTILDVSGGTRL